MMGAPSLHAAPPDGERYYAIPAQPLAGALAAFASESGVDIFFETGLARGRVSAPLNGRYTPAMALRTLLAGTGLEGHFTDRKSAYVFSPGTRWGDAAGRAHGSARHFSSVPSLQLDMAQVRTSRLIGGGSSSFTSYANRAVREIRSILNVGGGFTGRPFEVAIIVRIDRMGRIDTVGLTTESRKRHPERETEIQNRLVGYQLSELPPDGFASPLRFGVSSVTVPARKDAP